MQVAIRHTLAAIAFRFTRAIENCDDHYWDLEIGNGVRKPIQVLHHMKSVINYAILMLTNEKRNLSLIGSWTYEVESFLSILEELDLLLKEQNYDDQLLKEVIQGPVSDVLSHVGQLAMISRLNNTPVKGMNYSKAPVETGKIKGY